MSSTREIAILADGARVHFSLAKRKRDKFYSVRFKGPVGRVERSTKRTGRKQAVNEAIRLIAEEYGRSPEGELVGWDDALKRIEAAMRAANLRATSINCYKFAIAKLRDWQDCPPARFTHRMAEQYKAYRSGVVSVRTVANDVNNLRIIWSKWLGKTCRIVRENPWEDVEKPKADKPTPRVLTEDEFKGFREWLGESLGGWRLPVLVLEVKAAIGCRITELCSARSTQLRDGRIYFEAETTKGRKERASRLPADLYQELVRLAGPTYVFEAFSEQLRAIHLENNHPQWAARVVDFAPGRLRNWLQDHANQYCQQNGVRKFKLHNFRGTAMSRARQRGVSYDDAAVAFGCHPETMRQHYIQLDETQVSDSVMDRINSA